MMLPNRPVAPTFFNLHTFLAEMEYSGLLLYISIFEYANLKLTNRKLQGAFRVRRVGRLQHSLLKPNVAQVSGK